MINVNNKVMDGDIIEFNGMQCQATIMGGQGTYIMCIIKNDPKTGECINVAQGNEGYLYNINKPGSAAFRAAWGDTVKIIKRRRPYLFPA